MQHSVVAGRQMRDMLGHCKDLDAAVAAGPYSTENKGGC